MAFQIFWGDDEHTAADGPYSRLMKVRKWLVITAALAVLLTLNYYDAAELRKILPFIWLPTWLISKFVIGAGIYLLIQYGLLGIQLWRTYDIVIGERLTSRRSEEISKARLAVEQATQSEKEHARQERASRTAAISESKRISKESNEERDRARLALDNLESELESAENAGYAASSTIIRRININIENARRNLDQLTLKARAARDKSLELQRQSKSPAKSTSIQQMREVTLQAEATLKALLNTDPAQRRGYREAEMAIDLLRLVLPAVVAAGAIFLLTLNALSLRVG